MLHNVKAGGKDITITDWELKAIGEYWTHIKDLQEVAIVFDNLKEDNNLPDDIYNDNKLREELANDYRNSLEGWSQDEMNYERIYDYAVSDIKDKYGWEVA